MKKKHNIRFIDNSIYLYIFIEDEVYIFKTDIKNESKTAEFIEQIDYNIENIELYFDSDYQLFNYVRSISIETYDSIFNIKNSKKHTFSSINEFILYCNIVHSFDVKFNVQQTNNNCSVTIYIYKGQELIISQSGVFNTYSINESKLNLINQTYSTNKAIL